MLVRVVFMQQAFYFYLNTFLKRERYSYSVTFGYVPLITLSCNNFFIWSMFGSLLTERRLQSKFLSQASFITSQTKHWQRFDYVSPARLTSTFTWVQCLATLPTSGSWSAQREPAQTQGQHAERVSNPRPSHCEATVLPWCDAQHCFYYILS